MLGYVKGIFAGAFDFIIQIYFSDRKRNQGARLNTGLPDFFEKKIQKSFYRRGKPTIFHVGDIHGKRDLLQFRDTERFYWFIG